MHQFFKISLVSSVMVALTACSSLPGSAKQQGAVVGGASGAAVGAAVSNNRALGAIIGGAVGAAGGYVVGANKDKIFGGDKNEVATAETNSQAHPATPEAARTATTADINSDGFVTLDEVVALKNAGLSDSEMLQRLRATKQVFNLSEDQRKYLVDRGVSQSVIDQMASINQTEAQPANSVISKPTL